MCMCECVFCVRPDVSIVQTVFAIACANDRDTSAISPVADSRPSAASAVFPIRRDTLDDKKTSTTAVAKSSAGILSIRIIHFVYARS